MDKAIRLNPRDIKAFIAVAELGSVTRAAEKLGLTQPAVTRRIQSFEDALGNPVLFDRGVKPAILTATGMKVVEHCRRILAELEGLSQVASDESDPVGVLKVGVAYGLEEMLLTDALEHLARTFPRLRLQVSSGWSAELFSATRDGCLDCAVALLSTTQAFPSDLAAAPLAQEEIIVVSSQLPSRNESGVAWHLADLSDHDWVLSPDGCSCRRALCDAFERNGSPLSIGAEVQGEQLQLALLTKIGGLGIVPRRKFLRSELHSRLNIIEIADFRLPASIGLVRKSAGARYAFAIDRLESALLHNDRAS